MAVLWIYLILGVVAGLVGAVGAPRMGRSAIGAFFLGMFLWPIALLMTFRQVMRPQATLQDLQRIQDGLVSSASDLSFAEDPRTPPAVLEGLARMYDYRDESILLALAKNPSTPKSVLQTFTLFKNPPVSDAAAIQLSSRSV